MRTLRSKHDRGYLWILANGKCQICGEPLTPQKWHADHKIPYKVSKQTKIDLMQATHPECNLKKGEKMMAQKFELRKHQRDLIEKLKEIIDEYKRTRFLNVKKITEDIFPGGGKSLHPLIAGRMLIDAGIIDKILWVVPRTSLKIQGAQECLKPEVQNIYPHGLELREVETANDEDPTRGTDGFIITYQALVSARANNPERENNNYRELRKKRYLLFLDEVHHVTPDPPRLGGDQKGYTFYQAVKPLYDLATFVICSSGTLFRNNGEKVAFIDYTKEIVDGIEKEVPVRDIVYTYEDSLQEKANIRLYYNTGDTNYVSYTKNGRKIKKYKIENGDDRRVALSTEYGRSLFDAGVKAWEDYSLRVDSRSKLIIIGKDQNACREYQSLLSKAGHKCCLAISDEKNAHDEIRKFRHDPKSKILVTCQMAYEGLDCKQATHVIVLTDIRSIPWLIQMLTRVLRADYHQEAQSYEKQYGMCFCPDDPDMMDAISKLQGRLDGSVDCIDDELELLLSELDIIKNNNNESQMPIFEECESEMGGMSQINPEGETLPSDTRIKVEQYKLKHNLPIPESEIYKMLKITGTLHHLNDVVQIPTPPPERVGLTIREQEKKLRKEIQSKASRLDYKFGYRFGEWNKKVLNKFRYKKRKDMSVDELNQCLKWMIEEAKKILLEKKKQKMRENAIEDPIANYNSEIHGIKS